MVPTTNNNNSNGNSTWLRWLAGILFTLIFTILSVLGSNVIANDRIRATEDQRIEDCIGSKLEKIISVQSEMRERLARIEAKI